LNQEILKLVHTILITMTDKLLFVEFLEKERKKKEELEEIKELKDLETP